MKFVEASARAAAADGLPPLGLRVAMSGTAESLRIFLKGHGALHGWDVLPEFLPFGTLGQYLEQTTPMAGGKELIILLPWDFAPELDWRMGLGREIRSTDALHAHASDVASRLRTRQSAVKLYIAAPIPPLISDTGSARGVVDHIRWLASDLGARILDEGHFSLASYLATGSPIGGKSISALAATAIAMLRSPEPGRGKLLVTDFDNALWAGVVAEDGVEALAMAREGKGYKHFLYQSLLRRLRENGALLAGVSRNDPVLALAPLASASAQLRAEDFVAIRAGYGAKSVEIRALCDGLNIGLDAVLFVDDNPVELAEVEAALPEVRTLRFPPGDDDLPDFFDAIVRFFGRSATTIEDRNRTELYRRRIETAQPIGGSKGDIRRFLKDLGMRLTIQVRGRDDMERSVQLFSKTNQFNANGRRLSKEELIRAMEHGAWLLTAMLDDRSGSHGEIMVCLAEPSGKILGLAMSCRVFERRVEFVFVDWIARKFGRDLEIDYRPTDRNKPFRDFLEALGVVAACEGSVSVKSSVVNMIGDANRDLFEIKFQST